MAYNFDIADSDHIHWGNCITDHNIDISISVWAYPEGVSVGYLFAHWITSTGWGLRRYASDNTRWIFFINGGAGGEQILSAVDAVSVNTWQNIVVTFDDTGADNACNNYMYKNNSEIASSSTIDRIDSTTTDLGIGNRTAGDRDWDGGVAEAAVWVGHLLTSDQRQMLADGFSPLFIRPLPTFYAPCVRHINDIVGGVAGTNVNSADPFSHPSVIYPATLQTWEYAVAVGAVAPTAVFYGPLFGPLGGPV